MRCEAISLAHQKIVQQALVASNGLLSEYSFANLYLFRHVHEHALLWEGEKLFIKGKAYDQTPFLQPLSPYFPVELLQQEATCFFPIPEEWVSAADPSLFTVQYSEADSDYIYDMRSMSDLAGRHLSKKRNLIKQFTTLYGDTITQQVLDEQSAPFAHALIKKWRQNNKDEADFQVCQEAIDHSKVLALEGILFFCNKEPIGLVIGELARQGAFVLHFAKGDTSYKGVYQYMYQRLATSLLDRAKWLNMEQDLGLPELRQAKHSYQPAQIRKKFRLQLLNPIGRER